MIEIICLVIVLVLLLLVLSIYIKVHLLYKRYGRHFEYFTACNQYYIDCHESNLAALKLPLVAYFNQAVEAEKFELAEQFKQEIIKVDTLIEIAKKRFE